MHHYSVNKQPNVYHILGIPSSAGSLYTGVELAPTAYREAELVQSLQASGHAVIDEGDVAIPHYLPRHNVPPVRNWPAPRIVWEQIAQCVQPLLRPGHVPLLVGGDCSIVVGTMQALRQAHGDNVHVIAIDGHIDAQAPLPDRCLGAAAMGLWMLTHASPLWAGPTLTTSQVTVIGWSDENGAAESGIPTLSLAKLRANGIRQATQRMLETIDTSAAILVHFDIDILDGTIMPAAYSPNEAGMSYAEVQELVTMVLADPRVQAIEVTEYYPLRDLDQKYARRLVELLASVLPADMHDYEKN